MNTIHPYVLTPTMRNRIVILTKGMRIDTSRGHLPLQHLLRGFQVFEVWIVAMKRLSKRLPT